MTDSSDSLLERFAGGQRRALAEMLTAVEMGAAPQPPKTDRKCHTVGITGSGGAGKSTLVGALIKYLREQGLKVAVLASDPQSPLSGGALLGDRIRVEFDPADDGVFFRSYSTRGAFGGLSAAIGPSLPWLTAFGFDVVLVETVGVGQDQAAVRDVVDTLVLLVTPNTGDEVQWEKAGLIEVADLVVVNKSDLPGADRVRQQLTSSLTLVPTAHEIKILPITAIKGEGIKELWQAVVEHHETKD